MDWFRRQRRVKRVVPAEDKPPLLAPPPDGPPPDPPGVPVEVQADSATHALPFSLPQPFQVQIANPPPAPASVLIPQPLEVRVSAPPAPEVKPDAATHAFLLAEFGYITQTAFQSTEDRARVSGFFLTASSAVVAAVVGAKLDASPAAWFYAAFSLVFSVVIALGWLTILELAQLRAAWLSSVQAMNQIKAYYMERCDERARDAFAWLPKTVPPAFKPRSVAFLMFLSVAVVNFGLTVGLSEFAMLWQTGGVVRDEALQRGLVIGVVAGLVLAALQFLSYLSALSKD